MRFGSIAILQQTSQAIYNTVYTISHDLRNFSKLLVTVKNFCTISDITKKIKDGDVRYPRQADDFDMGAKIEFR